VLQLSDQKDIVSEGQPLGYLHDTVCRAGTSQPNFGELMEVLHRSFALFDKVFVLLDALDECESDKLRELYAALEEMYGWNLPCTHFLITSRKDGSILGALEGIVPRQSRLEFSRDAVNEDIRAWLEDELARGQLGSKIDRWQEPDSLKTRITTELMKRASGMYVISPTDP
jgi:hypothetical protein